MAWTTLSEDAIRSQLGGAELQALRTVQTETGQSDPLAEVVTMVIAQVRSYIPVLRADPSRAAGLLPESLHGVAIDVARHRLATRLAVGAKAAAWLNSEPRQKAYEEAISYLRDVARGLIAVESPPEGDTPATSDGGGWFGGEEVFRA